MRTARALFVALHLFAVSFMALPSPGSGLNRAAWSEPTVQGEFQSWTQILGMVGIELTVPELEEHLWTLGHGYESVREWVLWPFMPYYRHLGTFQSWRMFVAPHRYPGRLQIRVHEDEQWRVVYEARSDEHTWHRAWFDHDRMRASVFRYSWKHYRNSRRRFTDWVARQAAHDFPEADRVEVSWMRYRTPSPQEVTRGASPKVERDLRNRRTLGELR